MPQDRAAGFRQVNAALCARRQCLELKSLKMYLLAYRNLGIFYENVVNRFLRDVVQATQPLSATVTGEFTPRGGLHKITATG